MLRNYSPSEDWNPYTDIYAKAKVIFRKRNSLLFGTPHYSNLVKHLYSAGIFIGYIGGKNQILQKYKTL